MVPLRNRSKKSIQVWYSKTQIPIWASSSGSVFPGDGSEPNRARVTQNNNHLIRDLKHSLGFKFRARLGLRI